MATRCVPFDPADPANFQPEQRQREIAAILAAGVIRMRLRRAAAPVPMARARPGRCRANTSSMHRNAACMSQISPESGETRLELSHRSSPDDQCG